MGLLKWHLDLLQFFAIRKKCPWFRNCAHALRLRWVETSCQGQELVEQAKAQADWYVTELGQTSGNSARQKCFHLKKYSFATNKTIFVFKETYKFKAWTKLG